MTINYVVAIPTYNRYEQVVSKTLNMLHKGHVPANKIYLFVANASEKQKYYGTVPQNLYKSIIVGKKGITNQRKFISSYFAKGQYIVSVDDDVEALLRLNGDKLTQIQNVDQFIKDAYNTLKRENLYLWGIYPVMNPFFMKNNVSTGLKFIIGVMHGYINRPNEHLKPSSSIEIKEDYEFSILHYLLDGGVVRFNNVTAKTKFLAAGGVGPDRLEKSKRASEYLKRTYPDLVTIFHRKNGMAEIRLANLPRRVTNTVIEKTRKRIKKGLRKTRRQRV